MASFERRACQGKGGLVVSREGSLRVADDPHDTAYANSPDSLRKAEFAIVADQLHAENPLASLSSLRSREQSSSSMNETRKSASASKDRVRSDLNLAILAARLARSPSATAFADRPNSLYRGQLICRMSRSPSGDMYRILSGIEQLAQPKACPDIPSSAVARRSHSSIPQARPFVAVHCDEGSSNKTALSLRAPPVGLHGLTIDRTATNTVFVRMMPSAGARAYFPQPATNHPNASRLGSALGREKRRAAGPLHD